MGNEAVNNGLLIIDLTQPPAPGVLNQVSNVATPVIEGSTVVMNSAIALSVTVNGISYVESGSALTNHGDGTWSLQIPAADQLADNMYQVVAIHTDLAGNTASDPGVDDLLVDTLAPPAPGVLSQITNDSTPRITGVVLGPRNPDDALTVEVNGIYLRSCKHNKRSTRWFDLER